MWAGYVLLPGGQRVLSTISVGTRETFYGADGVRLLEAHLLDFAGDLYGQPIAVELSVYLRPQLEFNGVDALVDGLRQDELAARQWADSYNGSLGVDRGALA